VVLSVLACRVVELPDQVPVPVVLLDSAGNEIISMKKTVPKTNVVASEFPVQILSDESGVKMIKGNMRLLVW
jgi:hypothetical protein